MRALLTVAIAVGLTACACPPAPPGDGGGGGPDPLVAEVHRIAPSAAGSYFGSWTFIVSTDAEAREIEARFPRVLVISTESSEPPNDR